ncbi:MAG: hypothetical protein EOP04_02235 [Proteobacteria bacterium]|nr:MAG: hypothetical protein EOP04_02235 [Pseudomonadota bacterium]
MKNEYAIIAEIWSSLDAKKREEKSGLSKPNHILLAFYAELESIEPAIRYAEREKDLSVEELRRRIMNFIYALHKTAREKTATSRDMHYLTRDMLRDLGLSNLLRELKVIIPEKTRHLYELLIALNQKIEKCKTGVSEISVYLSDYYLNLIQHHELLLDPGKHNLISDELSEELTAGFFKAVIETAKEGKKDALLITNVRDILIQLDLKTYLTLVERYVSEKDKRGRFIYASGKSA